jgi:hypothetical protein
MVETRVCSRRGRDAMMMINCREREREKKNKGKLNRRRKGQKRRGEEKTVGAKTKSGNLAGVKS